MTELHIRKPKMVEEIATLMPALSFEDRIMLLEQYARTIASGVRMEAAEEARDRFDSLLKDYFSNRPSAEEYTETLHKIATEMEDVP